MSQSSHVLVNITRAVGRLALYMASIIVAAIILGACLVCVTAPLILVFDMLAGPR